MIGLYMKKVDNTTTAAVTVQHMSLYSFAENWTRQFARAVNSARTRLQVHA
ncbi:hypothetical protein DIPPA_28908 [Diplonema papillatum]|nr:hypothetical protein DIPPA_28908 [Diplonema papillatum]